MHAHSPASIRLMMALTPKRLFLSFSLSSCLSLFSAFFLTLTIGSINIFWKCVWAPKSCVQPWRTTGLYSIHWRQCNPQVYSRFIDVSVTHSLYILDSLLLASYTALQELAANADVLPNGPRRDWTPFRLWKWWTFGPKILSFSKNWYLVPINHSRLRFQTCLQAG